MRTNNSIKNTIGGMTANILIIIIGIVAQAVFIKILGAEYLGINGLFTNIISMLGIVELGIGSAIIYNLYKPIAENNISLIKSLMNFYKKSYRIIGLIVFILGICIMPFLDSFVGKMTINVNVQLVYILFIVDIVCSYFLSYKRSILVANQKNYIINIIHIIYTILLNVFQLLILYLTKSYYLYLIIKIIIRILENIVITIVSNKKYSYLKEKDVLLLDKNIEKDILKKIKALFYHKIGGFIVLGTDNIIISKFLGIIQVGLYSNYYLIINAVQVLFTQIISSSTASVGNMLVTSSKEENFKIFKRIRFLNFWLTCFTGISILVIIENFITIWIGSEYILPKLVLINLIICYYQKSMRASYATFKEAAGIFEEDKYVPIVESILNIIFSIILLKIFGLAGVFMGTIISGLALWCYSYPKFVYKTLFDRKYINYIKETLVYILQFIIIASITYIVSKLLTFNNLYIKLLLNILICIIVPNILMIIMFYKTDEFKYFINLLKKLIKRGGKNENK